MTRKPVEIIGDRIANRIRPLALICFEPQRFTLPLGEQSAGFGLGLKPAQHRRTIRLEHVVGPASETFHLVSLRAQIPSHHPCSTANALAVAEVQALIERSVIGFAGWFEPLARGTGGQIDFASDARHRPCLMSKFCPIYTIGQARTTVNSIARKTKPGPA